MTESLESLRRKIGTTEELKTVIKTMKAMAAVAIGPAERAVVALLAYEQTVQLGLLAAGAITPQRASLQVESAFDVVVFGSDQGMVGPFNDHLATFVHAQLAPLVGKRRVWPVGERVHARLLDLGVETEPALPTPEGVGKMTPLIGQLLLGITSGLGDRLYVAHNRPYHKVSYEPTMRQLLPFEEAWCVELKQRPWPTHQRPESLAPQPAATTYLLQEYAFVGLFKACAESLASEHGTRLAAMIRAERNVQEVRDGLMHHYHQQRQRRVSEELFDIVAGFEALS